ncbi:MAG: hypothetical protein Aureis2KO_25110 [Aureisphaera sp.]
MNDQGFMKTNALFFLLLFSVFIVTPAVINLCDNEADIVEFSIGEEEKTDTSLADSEHYVLISLRDQENASSMTQKITPERSSHPFWDTWYPDTFSPPPEFSVL